MPSHPDIERLETLDHSAIEARFEEFLKTESLKMTPQRRRIFDKAFAMHEHFSAERLYELLREEEGDGVSRATVYRALEVLAKGGFVETLETGRGEVLYEHKGPNHHDHMVCKVCGKIAEFQDEEIEALQRKNAARLGFLMTGHMLRLSGVCGDCAATLRAEGRLEDVLRELGA